MKPAISGMLASRSEFLHASSAIKVGCSSIARKAPLRVENNFRDIIVLGASAGGVRALCTVTAYLRAAV